jgi:hypothetical protein
MFWDFVATFAVGLTMAGIGLVARHLSRWRLPKWIVPACAGVGMLFYAIWSEYTWFDRTILRLPDGVVVASVGQDRAFWRPWTYAAPITARFIAVDRRSLKPDAEQPGFVAVDIVLMARWVDPIPVKALFDCNGHRRADMLPGVSLGPDGTLQGGNWYQLSADDPVMAATCREG